MVTTISGTTVTFTDGSTWGGANGGVTPDGNTSRVSQDYNIGHLILSNCIFYSASGYQSGGNFFWPLNSNNNYYNTGGSNMGGSPAVNTQAAANDARHGSQSYFALGTNNGLGALTGTWKHRGMACGAGINQTNGYFVLQERVA
jgi:hypothetical protein